MTSGHPNVQAVFLDRDGVINLKAPEGDYVKSPDELVVLPGVAEAIRRLNRAGLLVVIITNQRGVARGLMSTADLDAIHEKLGQVLARSAAAIDGVYACLHNKEDHCDCRKPAPGLLLQAAEDHAIDLARSVMIGDRESDIEAGRGAGCHTILVTTEPERAKSSRADHVEPDLASAVDWLLDRRN